MSKQIISMKNQNSDENVDSKSETESDSSSSDSSSSSSSSSHHHKRSKNVKKKRKMKKRKKSSSDSSESESDTKKKKHKKHKIHKPKDVVVIEKRNDILYVSSDDGKRGNINFDIAEKSEDSKWGHGADDEQKTQRRDRKVESLETQPHKHQQQERYNNHFDRDNKRGRYDQERQLRNFSNEGRNRSDERNRNDDNQRDQYQRRYNNRDQDRRYDRRDTRFNNDSRNENRDDIRGKDNNWNKGFNDRRNDYRFKKPDDNWKNRDENYERYRGRDNSRSSDGNNRQQIRRDEFRRDDEMDQNRRPEREDKWDRQRNGSEFQNRNQNQRDDDKNNPKIKSENERRLDWGLPEDPKSKPEVEKEKPNFALSGKLTEDTNKVNGIVIKYAEPAEARKPKRRWRLYPFKGEQSLPTLYIHRQSCYLIGRDRKICDLPVDHPSCSKQHAVLQYRLVPFEREDGSKGKRVRPYVIDLESSNGTFINNKKVEGKKYIELLEKDVLKFGFSSREYVILHENSKDEDEDDDVIVESV